MLASFNHCFPASLLSFGPLLPSSMPHLPPFLISHLFQWFWLTNYCFMLPTPWFDDTAPCTAGFGLVPSLHAARDPETALQE